MLANCDSIHLDPFCGMARLAVPSVGDQLAITLPSRSDGYVSPLTPRVRGTSHSANDGIGIAVILDLGAWALAGHW